MLANNTEKARFNMVAQQVRPCEIIDDRVLDILSIVPREAFVPDNYKGLAFADVEIPISSSSSMLKPLIEGQMLQALDISAGDKVLQIGTGSGFTAACMAKLGGKVTSYDIDAELSNAAAERISAQGINGVDCRVGDIFNTALPARSFDVIAITGSVATYNGELNDLLAKGGRLFIVVGEAPAMHVCIVHRTESGDFWQESLCETVIPALQNSPTTEQFQF